MKLTLLILFFLILSGASVEKKPENPPLSDTKPKSNTDHQKQETGNKQPSVEIVSEKTTERKKETPNQKTPDSWYDFLWQSNMPNWVAIIGWGIAAWIAFRTLKGMNEQSEATKIAATASIKSAEVAELALKTDRPYLLIEKARMFGIQGHDSYGGLSSTIAEYDHFVPNAVFSFRNFGKGPAFLDEAIIHLFPLIHFPKVNDFTSCKPADISGVEAVGAGEPLKLGIESVEDRMISKPDYEEIVKGNKRIFAWGRIRYKDVFEDSYETVFCWVIQPPIEVYRSVGEPPILTIGAVGNFVRGPKTHNYAK